MLRLKHQKTNPHSGESGYTLLEGLMAVIVVSVMLLAIGPVIAFSIGTRVQARRVELATQAAKSYIDTVKADQSVYVYYSDLDPVELAKKTEVEKRIDTIPTITTGSINDQPAPNGDALNCHEQWYCTTPAGLYCVSFDGEKGCTNESLTDMIVQSVRTGGKANQSYQLGVRVYRARSFSGLKLQKTKSDSLTTNALGNPSLPLIQMQTEISNGATFTDIRDRLKK
jgi:type II secretory pathway pseudopilin PulG